MVNEAIRKAQVKTKWWVICPLKKSKGYFNWQYSNEDFMEYRRRNFLVVRLTYKDSETRSNSFGLITHGQILSNSDEEGFVIH